MTVVGARVGRFRKIIPVVLWLMLVGTGFVGLLHYSSAPGEAGPVPDRWPTESRVSLDPEHFTLVMTAHPRCPCSQASVAELARIMARARTNLRAHVLFLTPRSEPAAWSRTALWRQAVRIPGVRVLADADGEEARRFGARTSGQVALYGPKGDLAFSGGITLSRGHQGDNPGAQAVLAATQGKTVQASAGAVFGCPLFSECRTSADSDAGEAE